MRIDIEPTPEIAELPINGTTIPLRVWRGTTSGGVPIEAYVLSIVPLDREDVQRVAAEIPSFMLPSREAFRIDVDAKQQD